MTNTRYFPEQLGRYHYRDLIGVGGFAAVIRCHDEELDSIVTIKVLLQKWAVNEDISSRFLQEARLLRRVRSEFVVTVHDIGELEDGRPYFVMEYADKGSLQSRLDGYAPNKFNDNSSIKTLIDTLANGLGALHKAGIVHRDIKPDNILLQSLNGMMPASRNVTKIQSDLIEDDEKILIGDLGLAKDTLLHVDNLETANATIVGGSAGYQAPEQTRINGKITTATDIYAATALFWRLFSNLPPPDHANIGNTLKNVKAPWREIFEKGLALDPMERYSSIEEWQQEINHALIETSENDLVIPPQGFSNLMTIPCPYKGLASYQPEDATYFCGRESLVDTLIKRLNRQPILVVGGPSGSGKSSLVRAGLIPAVNKGALPGSEKWRILLFTPGVDPLGELHYQLYKGVKEPEHSLEELRKNPALARHLGENQAPVLLCIDQFEELFTLCQNKKDQQVFIEALSAFLDPADTQAHLVIAVRADFYANCAMFPWLASKITDNQVLVGPMARNELRQAIEKPAQHAGLALEKGLVEAILDETSDDAGSLPLVAHALVETWSRRRHNTLTIEGFRATGGVAGAIAQSADTIYDHDLNKVQQTAMRRLLLQLVTPGEGAADTRRRITLTSLHLDEQSDLMHQLVDKLTDARLLTVDDNSVEIAHEALIRTWPRFRTWIDEDRENMQHRMRIDRSAREWKKADCDPDLLYRGTPLTLAMEWRQDHANTLSHTGKEFLDQSYNTQQQAINEARLKKERANRIRRWAIGALTTLTIVALIASFVALSALRTSQHNEKKAEMASQESNQRFVRALATSSANLVQEDPLAALILAAESNVRSNKPSIEARSLLVDSRESLAKATVIPFGSPIPVGDALSATINPQGSLIASGNRNGNIQLWDRKTGKLINNLKRHQAGVQTMMFSPDSQWLASGDLSGHVYLWDVSEAEKKQTPQEIITLNGEVWAVDFSHDGKQLAIASEDGTARLIHLESQNHNKDTLLTELTGGLNAISINPNDKIVVAGGGGGIIQDWDAKTGNSLWKVTIPSLAAIRELKFSPDGHFLSSCSDYNVELINPKSGELLTPKPFTRASQNILRSPRGCIFTSDNKKLISGANDGKIHLWEIASQRVSFSTLLGHKSGIEALAMNQDGQHLITLGQDHMLRRWLYQPKAPITQLLAHQKGGVSAFAMFPDGSKLASVGNQGMVHIWSVKDGPGLIRTLIPTKPKIPKKTSPLQSIAISKKGEMLAAGDKEGNIILWRIHKSAPPITIKGHKGDVYSLSFSPDGSLLASGGTDGQVHLWTTKEGKTYGKPYGKTMGSHLGGVTRLAFSPDGKELAVASMSGLVNFWNTDKQTKNAELQADDNTIWSIAYNRDGKQFVTSSDDEIVVIRSRDTMKILGVLSGHDSGATDAKFSPDGKTLVTSTRDGKIRLWDTASMTQIGSPLAQHKKSIWQLAWLKDSQHFISSGMDGDIHLWNILSIPKACELAKDAFDQSQIARYIGKDASLKACP